MSSSSHLPAGRRFYLLFFWVLVAAIPFTYVAVKAVAFSRNIIFWDEFDTALDLILKLDRGVGWRELFQQFFAINNEHRTVTSRLMFAVSYWLTGTVNFHVIGAIGNLFLVGAAAILVHAVGTAERRIRLGVVLAFLLFQLEHFESFFWSGASIDHFQIVTLAVGAIVALHHGTRGGVAIGAVLGLLATFTLAHGVLVWAVGAALLAHQRRWPSLAWWLACGALVIALFLYGFTLNPGHRISDVTLARIGHVAGYWLALLGAPLTLGDAGFAPWPGVALLVMLAALSARGALTREPVAMFSAFFAVGALAMVAVGRSEIAGSEINSRYLVLGALAWALTIFTLLEFAAKPGKPFFHLAWLLPALAVFAVSANQKLSPLVEGYIETRERAATDFLQHGRDGRGLFRLHPREGHADALLKMAEERGVYRLQPLSRHVSISARQPDNRIVTHLDELLVNERSVLVGGWAMLPDTLAQRGQIHVILQSPTSTRIYSTITLQRPDVAKAYRQPLWHRSGFRAVIPRTELPNEDFTVGVLIANGRPAPYLMTTNRLDLSAPEPAAVRGN